MQWNFFYSTIMLRFGETKVAKEEFNSAKKPAKMWVLMLII